MTPTHILWSSATSQKHRTGNIIVSTVNSNNNHTLLNELLGKTLNDISIEPHSQKASDTPYKPVKHDTISTQSFDQNFQSRYNKPLYSQIIKKVAHILLSTITPDHTSVSLTLPQNFDDKVLIKFWLLSTQIHKVTTNNKPSGFFYLLKNDTVNIKL